MSRDIRFLEDDISLNATVDGLSDESGDKLTRLNDGLPKSHPLGLIEDSLTNFTSEIGLHSPNQQQQTLLEPTPTTSSPIITSQPMHRMVTRA